MGDIQVKFPKPCSEQWGEMTPEGRNRHCARCATTIHDLSQYSLEEAEGLLNSNEKVCVRARVGAGGQIELRPQASGNARRMMVALGAALSLLTISEAALAGKKEPEGAISGQIWSDSEAWVTATAADGTVYKAEASRRSGDYKIKHLPPGQYQLKFHTKYLTWEDEIITVEDGKTAYFSTENPEEPMEIIVGVMERNSDFTS